MPIPRDYIEDYTKKHWGNAPDFVYETEDPRLPPYLSEMGKLQEVEIAVLDDNGRKIDVLTLDLPDDDRCILAYDKDAHRLYAVYPDTVARSLKRLFQPNMPTYSLAQIARSTRGRHAQGRYPSPVQAQSLGPCNHVIYWTHKKGHGPSRYKHELGENTHKPPDVCIDADGQLWFAGGNYTIRKHGIID